MAPADHTRAQHAEHATPEDQGPEPEEGEGPQSIGGAGAGADAEAAEAPADPKAPETDAPAQGAPGSQASDSAEIPEELFQVFHQQAEQIHQQAAQLESTQAGMLRLQAEIAKLTRTNPDRRGEHDEDAGLAPYDAGQGGLRDDGADRRRASRLGPLDLAGRPLPQPLHNTVQTARPGESTTPEDAFRARLLRDLEDSYVSGEVPVTEAIEAYGSLKETGPAPTAARGTQRIQIQAAPTMWGKLTLVEHPQPTHVQVLKAQVKTLLATDKDNTSMHISGHSTGRYRDEMGDKVDALAKMIAAVVSGTTNPNVSKAHVDRIDQWIARQDWATIRTMEEHQRPRILDVIEAIWGSDEILVRKDHTTFINLQYSHSTHKSAQAYLEALRRLARSVQQRLEYQNETNSDDRPRGGAHGTEGFIPEVRVLERFFHGVPEKTRDLIEDEMRRTYPNPSTFYGEEWRPRSIEKRKLHHISPKDFEELVKHACSRPGAIPWDASAGGHPSNKSANNNNKPSDYSGPRPTGGWNDKRYVNEYKKIRGMTPSRAEGLFKSAKKQFEKYRREGEKDPGSKMTPMHRASYRMRQLCTVGGEPTSACKCTNCARRGRSSPAALNQMATAPPSSVNPTGTTQYTANQNPYNQMATASPSRLTPQQATQYNTYSTPTSAPRGTPGVGFDDAA